MCYSCVDANNVSEVVSIESDTISVLEESNDILIPLDGLKYDTYLLLSPDDEFVVAMNDIALDRKVSEMYMPKLRMNLFRLKILIWSNGRLNSNMQLRLFKMICRMKRKKYLLLHRKVGTNLY